MATKGKGKVVFALFQPKPNHEGVMWE